MKYYDYIECINKRCDLNVKIFIKEWLERLNILEDQIKYWTSPENMTDKTIETIHLYYVMCKIGVYVNCKIFLFYNSNIIK